MNKWIKLYVDDLRVPPEGFELARTVTEAITVLATTPVEVLSLDHDVINNQSTIQTFSEENFSAVARYVALMHKADQPKVIFLHTASHNGALSMARILSTTKSKVVRISPNGYEEEIEEFLKKWQG